MAAPKHEITNPIAKKFYDKAKKHIASLPPDARNSLPTLKCNGTDEFYAWAWYFAGHLRWVPAAFRAMEAGHIEAFTVPTQWPELFDGDYVPPTNIPRRTALHASTPRHLRESYDELKRRYGPNWGLKAATDPKRIPSFRWRKPEEVEIPKDIPISPSLAKLIQQQNKNKSKPDEPTP